MTQARGHDRWSAGRILGLSILGLGIILVILNAAVITEMALGNAHLGSRDQVAIYGNFILGFVLGVVGVTIYGRSTRRVRGL